MNHPLVSVIIPTYERPDELSRAIDSLKSQTYKYLEIIVVDDNKSPEWKSKTIEVIDSKSDIIIKCVFNEENLGASLSRNKGVDYSSGKYVTFLDDDDIYLDNKILNQIRFMEDHSYQFSFTDLIIKNDKGSIIETKTYDDAINTFNNREMIRYHLMYHMTGTPTFMIEKEVFQSLGGFPNIVIGEEFLLMSNALDNKVNIGYLKDKSVVAYREQNKGISSGSLKITGEKTLFKIKANYFDYLTKADIAFIKMRSKLVIAYAYFNQKRYLRAMASLLLSFAIAPLKFINFSFEKLRKD